MNEWKIHRETHINATFFRNVLIESLIIGICVEFKFGIQRFHASHSIISKYIENYINHDTSIARDENESRAICRRRKKQFTEIHRSCKTHCWQWITQIDRQSEIRNEVITSPLPTFDRSLFVVFCFTFIEYRTGVCDLSRLNIQILAKHASKTHATVFKPKK